MHNREIPVLLTEQYALGELTDKRKVALEREFGMEKLLIIKEEIEKQNSDFFSAHPALNIDQLSSENILPFNGKNSSRGKRFYARPAFFVPLSAAAALFIVLLGFLPGVRGSRGAQNPGTMENRIKGAGPQLFVYKQTTTEPVLLPEGAPVKANDVLQIKFNAGANFYSFIFSIDGRGNVTVLYPEDKESVATVEPFKTEAVGYGYKLDDAPAFERFFLITSEKEFDLSPVLTEARRVAKMGEKAATAGLKLPRGLEQSSILLEKKGNTNE